MRSHSTGEITIFEKWAIRRFADLNHPPEPGNVEKKLQFTFFRLAWVQFAGRDLLNLGLCPSAVCESGIFPGNRQPAIRLSLALRHVNHCLIGWVSVSVENAFFDKQETRLGNFSVTLANPTIYLGKSFLS